MELCFLLADFWSKTYFTKYFPFNLKSPKQIIETGNRIIETGNGIIFPTYRPLIKSLFYKIFSIQPEESKNKL